jgi:hypothetical protein
VIHQVGGIAFSWQDPVEADCVKFGDDDYSNNPPEMEKAFIERRRKDGPPIGWPDYEEWSQAYDADMARERAMYRERADSWQLVQQIDSDYESGMIHSRTFTGTSARTPDRAWAGRAVGEGVKSCPSAGCGRSARPVRRAGCGNGVTVEPLRHRQTKEVGTDMFSLTPPRHISTLPDPAFFFGRAARQLHRFTPMS